MINVPVTGKEIIIFYHPTEKEHFLNFWLFLALTIHFFNTIYI